MLLVLTLPVPAQIPVLLFPSRPIQGLLLPRRGQGRIPAEGRGTGNSSGLSQTLLEVTQLCPAFPHALKSLFRLALEVFCLLGRGDPEGPHIHQSPKPQQWTQTSPKPPKTFIPVPSCSHRSSLGAAPLPGMSFKKPSEHPTLNALRQNPSAKAFGPELEISGTPRC